MPIFNFFVSRGGFLLRKPQHWLSKYLFFHSQILYKESQMKLNLVEKTSRIITFLIRTELVWVEKNIN